MRWLKTITLITVSVWITHLFLASFGTTAVLSQLSAARVKINYFSELKNVSDVLKVVQAKYVEEEAVKDEKALIEGAIEGILKKLDDPFSRYMPPENAKSMQEETDGEFGGLGIILGIKDKVLTVISPMEGTPAYSVGVEAGDKIVKINNKSTEGMSVEQAVKILRGKPKTAVTISVFREGEKDLIDFTIIRDVIKVPSVKSGMAAEGIGYARLTGFVQTSGKDLLTEIEKMEKNHNMKAMILDLRGNPGGLLTAAVEVGQLFLKKDQTVVSIKGREGDPVVFKSQFAQARNWPLIVMIDGGSASASEIVAGAVKDTKRAILLGTKSFGKGSVQTVLPLTDGSALALTTAYYYTPANIKIHKIGIEPDLEVKFPKLTTEQLKEYREELEQIANRDYDRTKKKQLEFLHKDDKAPVSSAKTEATSSSAPATESVSSTTVQTTTVPEIKEGYIAIPKFDVQLQRAVEVLKASDLFLKLYDKK